MSEWSLVKQYGLTKLTNLVVVELMDVWEALSPTVRKIIQSENDFILYAEASLSRTGINAIDKALRDGESVEWEVKVDMTMIQSIVKSDNELVGYTQGNQWPTKMDVEISYKIRGMKGNWCYK